MEGAIEATNTQAQERAVEIANLKQRLNEKDAIVADMGPRQEKMARANAELTAQMEAVEKELATSIEKASVAAAKRAY